MSSDHVAAFAALAVGRGARPPALQAPRFEVRVADVQATMQAPGRPEIAVAGCSPCPGAEFGPARQWPTLNFAELGRQFAREGLGTSGCSDRLRILAVSEGVAATRKVVTNLVGRTTLSRRSTCCRWPMRWWRTTPGLMHLAPRGRPLVAVYGPSDPGDRPVQSAQPAGPARPVVQSLRQARMSAGDHGLSGRHMPVEQVADALHAVTRMIRFCRSAHPGGTVCGIVAMWRGGPRGAPSVIDRLMA